MKSWPSLEPYGKFFSMPGGDLFYYDSEGGADAKAESAVKQAVILIHGLGDEADTWRHVFPLIAAAGYRVIAPDLPGFGRSLWKGRIDMRCHCMAIVRLLTMAGIASAERPAVLAGSSLGAGIAELAAFRRSDLAKALILIDGCFPLASKAGPGVFWLMLPSVGRKWYRSFRENHEAAWKSLYPYYGDLDALGSEDREFLRERVIARVESDSQERGYLSTFRSMNLFFMLKRGFFSRKIQKYPGKIALLWGEKDGILSHGKAAPFCSLRPDALMSLIPGAGHLPHQEKHEETAARMLQFLQED